MVCSLRKTDVAGNHVIFACEFIKEQGKLIEHEILFLSPNLYCPVQSICALTAVSVL